MANTPRNVLLITTDQQRFDTIAAGGNPHVITPHLDWLCDRGIRLTCAYADSPICGPSRYTIMTGRHAFNQQVDFNCWNPTPVDRARTLPGLLGAAGYQTRAQGKMHFKPERDHLGFQQMELLEDYYRDARRRGIRPMDSGLGQNEMAPAISSIDPADSLTRWTVDRSVDFLETRDLLRPFFLWTSFSKPHPPFDPPREYWELYRDRAVPAPARGDWSPTPDAMPAGFRLGMASLNSVDRFDPRTLQDAQRAYYALITQVDYALGHLFARLREMELFDSTTIIFTTDHGEMLGDHHLGAKTVHFEGSAHLPCIIMPAKGLLDDAHQGTTFDGLVSLADVLPTCLAAAGLPAPAGIDGSDILAMIRDGSRRTTLHGEALDYHLVIDGHLKYLWSHTGGHELLFDLAADPREERNLAEARPADLQRLRGLLIARLARTGHPGQRDGRLVPRPLPDLRNLRGKWPGFHSLVKPNEVCH